MRLNIDEEADQVRRQGPGEAEIEGRPYIIVRAERLERVSAKRGGRGEVGPAELVQRQARPGRFRGRDILIFEAEYPHYRRKDLVEQVRRRAGLDLPALRDQIPILREHHTHPELFLAEYGLEGEILGHGELNLAGLAEG